MENSLQFLIAKDIASEILTEQIKEGETLPAETELTKKYNTSRPTIREAIKLLSTRKIVKAKPRAGTKVLPINNWNVLDPIVLEIIKNTDYGEKAILHFSQIRRFIEGEVAYLASINITPQGKKELFEAFNEMLAVASKPFNHQEWIEVDLNFHKTIYNNCGNIIYSAIGDLLSHIWRSEITLASENKETHIKEHHQIYYAIVQGNANEARKASNYITQITGKKIDNKTK